MATGYDPLFWEKLQALQAAAAAQFGSGTIGVGSGFRSPEQQAQIIAGNWHKFNLNPADKDRWLADVQQYGPEEAGNRWESVFNNATRVVEDGRGTPFRNWIALPARSNHQKGLAADLSYASPEVRNWAHQNAPEYNLAFPLSNENWHVELAGARSGQGSPQMRVSTKDAQMTPMDQKKPETLWERLKGTNERSGLNAFEAFAAALDPLILPEMRAGGVIREQGGQRAAFAKEGKTKNATINELRKRAATGDKTAQRYLDAISSGALDPKTGFSGYLSEVASEAQFNRSQAATASQLKQKMDLDTAQAAKVAKMLEDAGYPQLAKMVLASPASASNIMSSFASNMLPKDKTSTMTADELKAKYPGQEGITPGIYNVTEGPGGVKISKVGSSGPAPESAFQTENAKLMSKRLGDISQAGLEAQASLGQIQVLEQLLQQTDTGFSQIPTTFLNEAFGLDLRSGGAMAAQAIINQLVPAQRPMGSGTMSDADLALYKGSLPSLLSSSEGNKIVTMGMTKMAQYKIALGNIADKAIMGQLTPAQADAEMKALGNPLADVVAYIKGNNIKQGPVMSPEEALEILNRDYN